MTKNLIDQSDPAVAKILKLAAELNIKGNPDKAAHNLGSVILQNGREVLAHVVHAVDAIITDNSELVVIMRTREPGLGKPCLPGGFIDPKKNGVETGVEAATREAQEEVGLVLAGGVLTGNRIINRPFDVRVAYSNMEQYGITKGDIFMVSTQGVRFYVPDLKDRKLTAGDDARAGSARLIKIDTLSKDKLGIPDHFGMIMEAVGK